RIQGMRHHNKNFILAASAAVLFMIVRQSSAALWTVSSTADDNGATTLRTIVGLAGNGDTINFAASLAGQTITLTKGEISIKKSLAVNGFGPNQLGIVNLSGRVFHVQNGPVSVSISGLRLTGQLSGTNGADGRIFALDGPPG